MNGEILETVSLRSFSKKQLTHKDDQCQTLKSGARGTGSFQGKGTG